jgi:hypothetical protein
MDKQLFIKYMSDAFCIHKIKFIECNHCLNEMIKLYYISRL